MNRRLVKAVLLSPLSVIVGGTFSILIIEMFLSGTNNTWTASELFGSVLQSAVFGLPIAYIGVFVFALPLHFLLRRFNLRSVLFYVVPALALGAAFANYMARYYFLRWYVIGIVCSVTVAYTFWAIVRLPNSESGI